MGRSHHCRTYLGTVVAGLWIGLLAGGPVLAAKAPEPDGQKEAAATEARIAGLIEQLGAEDFAARERAQAELAQLGLEAFDALHEAQNHNDPEVALRARYLVRSMSVRWFSESDPPDVVRILKGYGDLAEGERKNRMDRLAALENRQGLVALCRLSRFETLDPLAKYGALKVLELGEPQGDLAKAELSKTIAAIAGSSKRTAAQWLRLYAQTLVDPASALPAWDQATQAEQELLAKNPERTSPDTVRDLYRYQVGLLQRLHRDDEAISVIRRTFDLLDGSFEQVQETVDWLMQRKAWPVVLEVAEKFRPTFDERAELLYCLAETYHQLGQKKLAEETAQKALAIRSDNLEEHLRIGSLLEEQRGLTKWAEREYRAVLKAAQPGSVPDFRARFLLSELLHDQLRELPAAETLQPVCDLLQKDENAKETCARASNDARSPEGVIARMNYFYACHYHEQQDYEKERRHLQTAIESDPTDADVLIAMYRLPNADQAWQADTKRRIEDVAGRWHATIQQIMMELETAGNEQLRASTEWYLAIECNQFAWLVGNTFGDYDEAVKLSHKSLELRPNYAGFLDTLGRCYYAKGDLVNAVKYQSQAVRLSSHSGQIRRQLEFFLQEAKNKGVDLSDDVSAATPARNSPQAAPARQPSP